MFTRMVYLITVEWDAETCRWQIIMIEPTDSVRLLPFCALDY